MKKKATNEDVKKLIGGIVKEINEEQEKEFRLAQCLMDIAENKLIQSLNSDQRALFDEYCQKRTAYYDIAREIYVKKYKLD